MQSGELTLLSDPFQGVTGLTPPRLKADIVLATEALSPLPYGGNDAGRVVFGPGEYEIRGVEIAGWPLKSSPEGALRNIFRVVIEDMRLGFLGHCAEYEDDILEKFGEIDILIIPAGGAPFLSEESAVKLIKQVDPRIVIPAFFKIAGLKRRAGDLHAFLKEMGQNVEPVKKFLVRKKELPQATKVVALEV